MPAEIDSVATLQSGERSGARPPSSRCEVFPEHATFASRAAAAIPVPAVRFANPCARLTGEHTDHGANR